MGAKMSVALGLGLGVVLGCKVPNTDHCLHKAADSNAWCVENHDGLPYCSPCEGESNGCVKEQPTEEDCPEYSAATTSGTGTASDGTGDSTGSSGETGSTGDAGSTG